VWLILIEEEGVLVIKYGEEIVAAVFFRERFSWYVSEKEIWFLDYEKFRQAFIEDGLEVCSVEEVAKGRFGVGVVDENSAGRFLASMTGYKFETGELRDLFRGEFSARCKDDIIHLMPAILVDFDSRMFFSNYYEAASFEEYAPDGWSSEYSFFLERIPLADRYWILDGVDVFSVLED
jgi:hypothetical protein